ncbi:MAG TPA: 16S rRNA (guanine(966)-N(2))-methyltransferase RsmD [Terriglobales bacterium]|nr:16S rRNA (guanine(966)-N(2))-methyltransferase RsmD [Terriglobales bacterium]
MDQLLIAALAQDSSCSFILYLDSREKPPVRNSRSGKAPPLRVIAGQYGSRPLHSLRGLDLRPTSDRLRETLFNVLSAGNPSALEGSVWIDLYAGTGAVGIEALSRGARQVYFVESSLPAIKLIRQNLASLGVAAGFELLHLEATKALQKVETRCSPVDFVFLDPPYRMREEYARSLRLLASSSLLHPASLVTAEHEKKFDPGGEFGILRRYRRLEQGDAALSFYRWESEL